MLFNINEAIKLRTHYYPILKGNSFSNKTDLITTGIIICKPGDLHDNIKALVASGMNDNLPFLTTSDQTAKEYQIYVLAYDGSNFWHSDLDAKLTELNIPKIY